MFRARVRLSKTMSVRMDRENYDFLHEITKEEGSDLSKAVRDMVTRGRILLAVERYKKGEASLGRAAELAGVPVGQMMTILTEFGVESRLEKKTTCRDSRIFKRSGDCVSTLAGGEPFGILRALIGLGRIPLCERM